MQKKILLAILLTSSFSCFGQIDYGYLRIAGMLDETLKSAIPEIKFNGSDTFSVFQIATRSFVGNTCLPLKYTFSDRNNPSRILKESNSDSTIYLNGKIKSRIYFSEGKPFYQIIFGVNANGKIDTSYQQRYDNLGNPYPIQSRSILYRNRFGLDSLYITQNLNNGIWKLNDSYHEFTYDNAGRITQAKYGAYYYLDSLRNVYSRTQTHVYTYTGNNLTLRVDSIASSTSATRSTIDRITKRQDTYDALDRFTQRRFDVWTSASPINAFTPESLYKITVYNAQNKVAESISSTWTNNAWEDTRKSVLTYSNNNLDILELGYGLNNSTWVLGVKYISKYCGVVNASKDLQPLDLKIFPNPAQDVLTFEGEKIDKSKNDLFIFDNKGGQIFQKKDVEFPYNVNVSSFPNGFYFIRINSEHGQTVTRKIVILR